MIALVATGAANLASVRAAFGRLGRETTLAETPEAVRSAERVVLPGVGAFGPAIAGLRERGLDEALIERLAADRPTLAICLGFQLLFERSAEAPGAPGLGVFSGGAERFAAGLRTPQMGWAEVSDSGGPMLQTGWAYYANSYRVEAPPEGASASLSVHGTPYVAALERGALLACQFHPELSGAWGAALLTRWLEA